MKKKDLSRAYTDFNRALELNPEMAQAYQGRGAVRLGRGEPDAAVLDLNRALELNNRLMLAYMNRGLAFLLLHKDDEAEQDFARVTNPGLKDDLRQRIQLAKELRKQTAPRPN